jgi:hypothetical protein
MELSIQEKAQNWWAGRSIQQCTNYLRDYGFREIDLPPIEKITIIYIDERIKYLTKIATSLLVKVKGMETEVNELQDYQNRNIVIVKGKMTPLQSEDIKSTRVDLKRFDEFLDGGTVDKDIFVPSIINDEGTIK